jgi:hypothetical protein
VNATVWLVQSSDAAMTDAYRLMMAAGEAAMAPIAGQLRAASSARDHLLRILLPTLSEPEVQRMTPANNPTRMEGCRPQASKPWRRISQPRCSLFHFLTTL